MVGDILSIRDVVSRTKYSRSAIYRFVTAGTFPKPTLLSARKAVWRAADVDKWLSAKFNMPADPQPVVTVTAEDDLWD